MPRVDSRAASSPGWPSLFDGADDSSRLTSTRTQQTIAIKLTHIITHFFTHIVTHIVTRYIVTQIVKHIVTYIVTQKVTQIVNISRMGTLEIS